MMDDEAAIRRTVRRVFELRDINLKPDALTFLTNFMKGKDFDGMKEFSRKLVDTFVAKKIDDEAITLEKLKNCLKNDKEESSSFKIINCFDVAATNDENHLPPSSKIEFADALRSRFKNIKSRVDSISIIPIELLYSRTKAVVSVLGMLCKSTSNSYIIEDDTGSLKVKLDSAVFSEGIFFEGGVYEFHGVYRYGLLKIETVTLPKLRPEERICRNLSAHWSSSDAIVVMSDVWLDDSESLKRIYNILRGFAPTPPYMFVMCGNFLSQQHQENVMSVVNKAFEHLANILLEFKNDYLNTQFVLISSSDDFPVSTALPRDEQPFGPAHFKEFDNVHFASNPSTIQCKNLNLYVVRDDIVEKMCRSAIKAPSLAADIAPQFCATLLSQRHCSPLPVHLSPKILHKDDCFQFPKLPDVIVVADKFESFIQSHHNCQILNPGSFSSSGYEFLVYYPKMQIAEQSSCP